MMEHDEEDEGATSVATTTTTTTSLSSDPDSGPSPSVTPETMVEFESYVIPPTMGVYAQEYQKLLQTCRRSVESESRLNQRAADMLAEIRSSHDHLNQSASDERAQAEHRQRLQADMEYARLQVHDLHKLESEKQIKINELRQNISILKDHVSNGGLDLAVEQEDILKKLSVDRMKLVDARESDQLELNQLTFDITHQTSALHALEHEFEALEKTHEQIVTDIQKTERELLEHNGRKKLCETNLFDAKREHERLDAELVEKSALAVEAKASTKRREAQYRESKQHLEAYLRQYDVFHRKERQYESERQSQRSVNATLEAQFRDLRLDVTHHDSISSECRKKRSRLSQLIAHTEAKLDELDQTLGENASAREALVQERQALMSVDVIAEQKKLDVLETKLVNVSREESLVGKMQTRSSNHASQLDDVIQVQHNTLINLGNEIRGFHQHVSHQRSKVLELVSDREMYERLVEETQRRYLDVLEQVKLQQLQMTALQKKIVEGERKLKQQQNLYEAVRCDRNLYCKNLIELQKDMQVLKRKFKIMMHDIEQLKEEITAKDFGLVREHFNHHKVEKEKEALGYDLTRIEKQIQSSEQILSNQTAEISKLSAIIQEAQAEEQRQAKEFKNVIHDRDTLRSQLMQRNTEVSQLYEKMKILKSTLYKGQGQFKTREADVRDLENEVAHLSAQASQSQAQLRDESALRDEVLKLGNDILQEEIKIRALQEEYERPLNIHRWRTLEGKDPERYEMIRKIQKLQKKLIEKHDLVVTKNVLIEEKEQLYVELKQVLNRQPGPEVVTQLQTYQSHLKEKKFQHLEMEKELNMYKNQVDECRRTIKALGQDQQKLIQKWVQEQDQEQQHALLLEDDHPSNREEDSDVLDDQNNNQLTS